MNENNRMPSIARRINLHFWLKELSVFLWLDLALVALFAFGIFLWRESLVPNIEIIDSRYFLDFTTFAKARYVIEAESGKLYIFYLKEIIIPMKIPAIIFLVFQGLQLIGDIFGAKNVRNMMKPLNEIAIKTEELSNMNFNSEKVENFEQAIDSLNPDMPNAKIITGDEELQSLEIAINNLLERMRESHRQQDRFVSDASHELRTPIAVIQGYVNMLDRWGKNDEKILNESIEALKNESEQMKVLVEQLLFLARGDSGRNTLTFTDFDLNEVVKEVWEESLMIDETHKYILLEDGSRISSDQALLNGDAAMIKQSLRILVQNAAKYSNEGDSISLGVKIIDNRLAYVVQDEGVGMSGTDVVHVFERFYRSDNARGSSKSGTGLGLSIAKWIIDAHKGTIEILSRPDFGTRFTVKFSPLVSGDEEG